MEIAVSSTIITFTETPKWSNNHFFITMTMYVLLYGWLLQRDTGLDLEQVDSLKMAFDKFDKEETGVMSATAMQMIFKVNRKLISDF